MNENYGKIFFFMGLMGIYCLKSVEVAQTYCSMSNYLSLQAREKDFLKKLKPGTPNKRKDKHYTARVFFMINSAILTIEYNNGFIMHRLNNE